MIRRKLAAYTILFIAGTAAGYFMSDRSRPVEAAGFAASVMISIMLTGNDDENSADIYRDRIWKDTRIIFAMLFICGFFLFSIRSISYERTAIRALENSEISGRVMTAEIKDEDLIMLIRMTGDGPPKVRVTIRGCGVTEPFEIIGAVIEAVGEYNEIMPADDPGCFDYRLYMRSKGVCVSFKAYSFEITDEGRSIPVRVRRHLYRSREDFISRFDGETAAFIRGIIFGDKSEIDEDTVREFNENSTGHILAVSGLHIGFLYGLLRILTGRRRNKAVSALIIVILIMYGEMTMWSPATVRAIIVMSISLLSLHFERQADLLSSVSLAAFLILLKEPYQLFNAGFQLSFMAMCGIAFFTKPISRFSGEALGVMLAVQMGTLPLTAYSFHRFNPLSMLINVPVILLASVMVPFCIMMLITETVFGGMPHLAEDFIELITYSVVRLNKLLNFNGGFSIKAAGVGGAAVIAAYLIMLGGTSEWVRVTLIRDKPLIVLKAAAMLFLPVVMLGACLYDGFSNDEIVFVAVGQGDCVHIRAEGRDILIDGGGSDVYNVGENILMPYLLHEGVYKVDMALLTHLHADHYKGISELASEYPVGVLGIPVDYRESPDNKSKLTADTEQIIYINPDTRIDIADEVCVEPIWPVTVSDEPFSTDDSNEHNTVYMIHYKGIKVMVTGDLLEEDELQMVEYYEGTDTLKCDVLKVAHHGSRTSSSETFLDAASPSVAVIQAGRNNFYGHPHAQTLERLEKRGIRVCRTDINGAVGLDIRHGRIYVELFHPEEHS